MSDSLALTEVQGRASVIVFETQSGVIVHIRPISLATLKAMQSRAEKEFPPPDEAPYRHPDGETALDPNQLSPANENSEYNRLMAEVNKKRGQWVDRGVFEYCVTFPAYPSKQGLVAAFQTQLATLKKYAELPDDDYEAILFHIIFTWNEVAETNHSIYARLTEYQQVIRLALQSIALSPDEVVNGVRFFRPNLQK